MPQLNSPMDILRLLEKSNCRKCGELTCLAFAAAVFKGQKSLLKKVADTYTDFFEDMIRIFNGRGQSQHRIPFCPWDRIDQDV